MKVEAARDRARRNAERFTFADGDGRPRRRRIAIGDPQGPIDSFFTILDRHVALGDDGQLAPDVHLVSIGDHFDWGGPADRDRATREGLEILAWLAAHPPDQVTLLLGNHDLARVGELAHFDAATFDRARAEADLAYRGGDIDRERELELLAKHPEVPNAEVLARDYSCFSIAQRQLVLELLGRDRFKLAHAAARDLLLVHAAVTSDDLTAIHLSKKEHDDAFAIDAAIAEHVTSRARAHRHGRLDLMPLFVAGDALNGEARGIAAQRPSDGKTHDPELFDGPPRRRFDPRNLPLGLTQVVGHVRDPKARRLLGAWVKDEPKPEGALRMLTTNGRDVAYVSEVRERPEGTAQLLFIDGGMRHTPAENYALLDLEARRPA